jgi:prepilin-type N-terminal cleavage/methylation domain-containing protein
MEVKVKTPNAQRRTPNFEVRQAFTLIELLVVITIVVILMGLLFPAFRGVQDQAKKTQAKNDLTQIVTAVNAFYTEYGRYPTTNASDVTFSTSPTNDQLFDVLRNNVSGSNAATVTSLNPRQIVFISPPDAKDPTNPRGGIKNSTGEYFDPWGKPYIVRIDADYDNQVDNPYTADTGAGSTKIRRGVIAWSLGKDGLGGSGAKTATPPGASDDDVISWQ